MPATLGKERYISGEGSLTRDGATVTRTFEVDGETDPRQALADLAGNLFSIDGILGVWAQEIEIEIEEDGKGGTQLLASITYAPNQGEGNQDEATGENWEWDMVAQTRHINAVKEAADQLTWRSDIGGAGLTTGENYTTAIGVNGDTVEGVDVYRPRGALRVTKWYDDTVVDATFRQNLYDLQNTVNNAAWFDWGPREVLFLGSRIVNNYNTERTQVTLNFLFGRTVDGQVFDVFDTDPTIGFEFTTVTVGEGVPKKIYPWQYLWFQFERLLVPDSLGAPTEWKEVEGIRSVNLATVYEQSNFTTGFGLSGP